MSAVFSTPKGYQRLQNFALDSTSVFTDLTTLQTYVDSNGTAYQGQVIALIDSTGVVSVKLYILDYNPSLGTTNKFELIEIADSNGNGGLNDALALKIDKASIEDSLTSTEVTRVLSANQGNVVKGLIDAINTWRATSATESDYDTIEKIIQKIKDNSDNITSKLDTSVFNNWKINVYANHHHSPSEIDTDSNYRFVSQEQINKWDNTSHDLSDLSHTELRDIGVNSHAAIDTHIAMTDGNDNPHGITKASVGLSNVPNTDTTDPGNIVWNTNSFVLPTSVIPQIAITSVQTAADVDAMLALTTQEGDIVIRSDNSTSYIRNSGTAGTMAAFTELVSPADGVLSIAGHSGNVTLADLGLDKVDNTADLDKPISIATHNALNIVKNGMNKVQTAFSVKSVDQGFYHDGTLISAGTTIDEVLRKMLQKQIPPTYHSPSANLVIEGANKYEVGSLINPKMDITFNQQDAGSFSSIINSYSGSGVATAFTQSPAGTTLDTPYTPSAGNYHILIGTVSYKTTIIYDEGPIKNDNFGNPYPAGHISAGSVAASKSIHGVYRSFYGADSTQSAPANSSQVRALESSILDLHNGSTFNIAINAGDWRVAFAIPKVLGDVQDIISVGLGNMSVKSAFNKSTMSVSDATGTNTYDYYVYSFIAGDSWQDSDTYHVIV